ncbi:MAG: glycosyltransferase, partial [Alphaproteobacteria bacterium]|nr:glycosyltransferase [Alphaproteobacteria bacterium]
RHPFNRGFPGAANTGIHAAMALRAPHDVVLLNSDTIVPPGWLEALRAVVHATPDVGTATPLSNDATILSYPNAAGGNALPNREALHRTARQAATANRDIAVEIPSAVGFCMYIRRECLVDAGVFREDLFAQGYGEENDFCIRARHLGWRHVAAPGAFVAHVGGQSFGAAREQLIERNLAVLERAHPGYHALIAEFQAADPLAAARQRIDVVRWRAGRRANAVLLITHASGGGVERVIRERCRAIRAAGGRAIVLRSVMTTEGVAAYLPGLCAVEDGGLPADTPGFHNLRCRLPGEINALARLLRGDRPGRIEVHHLLGHDHAVLRLATMLDIPIETYVHDYAAFCPRISLVGRDGRYCGEPENLAVCEACVRDVGSNLAETIGVRALRGRSAADLRRSSRIVVPSEDVAARLRRHFPGVAPSVEPLEDDTIYPAARPLARAPERIAVIGGIGTEKGYDVLLACARNAAARRLNLHFTVIGHTHDDERLIETGHVFVTGPYKEAEVVGLIRSHEVDMAWQPSIWPETWCFTLGIAWRAGLCVAAFDLGAIAERIRRNGRGWLLPLGLPPAAINSAFVGLRWAAGA